MMHIFWLLFYVLLGFISVFMSYYLFFAIDYLLAPERHLPEKIYDYYSGAQRGAAH